MFKTVVGIAGDTHSRGLGEDAYPEFYLPIGQTPADGWNWVQRSVTLVAKARNGEAGTLAGPMRAAVQAVAPGVPVYELRTMDERLRESLSQERFATILLASLGRRGPAPRRRGHLRHRLLLRRGPHRRVRRAHRARRHRARHHRRDRPARRAALCSASPRASAPLSPRRAGCARRCEASRRPTRSPSPRSSPFWRRPPRSRCGRPPAARHASIRARRCETSEGS